MALLDILTRQDLEAVSAKLDKVLAALAKQAGPAPDELLTAEQVAAYTHFDVRTVRQWAREGRFNAQGKRVYLQAYEYCGGLQRFKRADVEAFGLGIGVLTPSSAGKAPQPTKQATGRQKKTAPIASESALKVA